MSSGCDKGLSADDLAPAMPPALSFWASVDLATVDSFSIPNLHVLAGYHAVTPQPWCLKVALAKLASRKRLDTFNGAHDE